MKHETIGIIYSEKMHVKHTMFAV